MLPGIKVGAVRLKYHVSRHLLEATTVYSKCVVYESIICGQWKYHTWRQLFQATAVKCVACESGDTYVLEAAPAVYDVAYAAGCLALIDDCNSESTFDMAMLADM